MDHDFWHERWEKNETGWHANEPNPHLVKYSDTLNLRSGYRVFIPLCGKTVDIPWLVSEGYKVCGAELAEVAIQQLFESMSLEPEVTSVGQLKKYSADCIDLFVGDFFELTAVDLGPVNAIFDRGALVALPASTRIQYAKHLQQITRKAQILLVCFDYDQSLLEGPPFSITYDEVKQLYAASYDIKQLASEDAKAMLDVDFDLVENVWKLTPK